jgi:hypothetical protein
VVPWPAEASQSFAGCGNQILLPGGMQQATRQPMPRRPMGHERAAYWRLFAAICLAAYFNAD